jgi:hypothetical protein
MDAERTNAYRDQLEKQMGEKTPQPAVKPLRLSVGDTIRANGCLYRVRKITSKDYVLRLIGVEVKRG